ncbi:hypothetical protein PIROE2DRAFT_11962 [Piromyces sp. E2]|nr:hypothetical protein PIROE2DRAFT_11962 [Piromyces sp. E2]|eukprot:OUM61899.1 hypothetical protein PIROE2DRAFT_11962 [Piromyces sp. E2]
MIKYGLTHYRKISVIHVSDLEPYYEYHFGRNNNPPQIINDNEEEYEVKKIWIKENIMEKLNNFVDGTSAHGIKWTILTVYNYNIILHIWPPIKSFNFFSSSLKSLIAIRW